MTMKKPLRLGVVGLGEGRSIMSAAIQSDLWELAMVCDLDKERLAARCAEFDFHHSTTKMEDLLNDSSIDAVALYTPDPLHAPHVMECLRAGKHVICTKPLFDTLELAREVYDVAKEKGKRVFVGQSSRFFEPMLHQRRDFEAGRNGELWCVEAHYHHDHR